MKVSTSN